MPRQARVAVPGLPHLVTQRGAQGAPIFFEGGDEEVYRDLLARETRRRAVEVWAWCLMADQVRLILNPRTADGLGLAVGEAHRRYANYINIRAGWTGRLFKSRFSSVAMDEPHLLAAARDLSLGPVREEKVRRPEEWAFSSVRAHLKGVDDDLVTVAPLLARVGRFADFLRTPGDGEAERLAALKAAESTGRPVGAEPFIADLERRLGRTLRPGKRGRRPGGKTAG